MCKHYTYTYRQMHIKLNSLSKWNLTFAHLVPRTIFEQTSQAWLCFMFNKDNTCFIAGCFFSCVFGSMPIAIAYLVPFDYSLMMTSGLFVKLR